MLGFDSVSVENVHKMENEEVELVKIFVKKFRNLLRTKGARDNVQVFQIFQENSSFGVAKKKFIEQFMDISHPKLKKLL